MRKKKIDNNWPIIWHLSRLRVAQTPIFPSYSTFTLLFLILVIDFHTWWRCHLIFVSLAQLSSHRSVIHKQDITELWLLSCASKTEIGWQHHQVWKFITKIINKIVKSGIWRKNRSLSKSVKKSFKKYVQIYEFSTLF